MRRLIRSRPQIGRERLRWLESRPWQSRLWQAFRRKTRAGLPFLLKLPLAEPARDLAVRRRMPGSTEASRGELPLRSYATGYV